MSGLTLNPTATNFISGSGNIGLDPNHDGSSTLTTADSRSMAPCKFFSRPGGCRNSSCPFLHAKENDKDNIRKEANRNEDEVLAHHPLFYSLLALILAQNEDLEDRFCRNLCGASVQFNELGHVEKISLSSDYSSACITGFAPRTSAQDVASFLRGLGFHLGNDCVRISGYATADVKAIVKIEDPSFAKSLCIRLKELGSHLSATPIHVNTRRLDCRKIYISWHKGTQSVWMNFGKQEIATRVAKKFNEGKYKCQNHVVTSSAPSSKGFRQRGAKPNPMAWTIILSDVPATIASKDIEQCFQNQYDKPRHIEMGHVSYEASAAEVSVAVRSSLEEHGPLKSFYLVPHSIGKRFKATAWFQDELDAKSACSLNNKPFQFLNNGKLSVTLVQSAKFKISTAIYLALKPRIDTENIVWKQQHLVLKVYSDNIQRFTTMKIEGDDSQHFARGRRRLNEILEGAVVRNGTNLVWTSELNGNGITYNKLKAMEKELGIVLPKTNQNATFGTTGPLIYTRS